MKKYILILLTGLLLNSQLVNAQGASSEKDQGFLGIGAGLPYGHLGLRFGYNVADQLNLFSGLGYNFDGLGYNFGMLYSFPSEKRAEFYLCGMYGTNAVIIVEGYGSYSKSYTGASFGTGIKLGSLRKKGNYWDIGLIVPIRSSEYQDDMDALKRNPFIGDVTEPLPVLLTIGYNFKL